MIEIYKASNTNYDYNGDAVLRPISCLLDTNDWKLTIDNPADENIIYFEKEAVLAVPTWYSQRQFFRIYDYEKSDTGVSAYARPIFFDSVHDVMLMDVRPTGKTGQEALNIMLDGTRYSGESDIIDSSTAYYIRRNLIEALMGDDENSFLNRWGGQPVFDNWKIILNKRAGGDYGAKAKLGYNLTSIREHINMDNVATRIIPVGYNGYTLDGNTPWIDSPNIDKYAIKYIREVKYEDVKLQEDCGQDEIGFSTLDDYRAELIKRAKADYENGTDLPQIDYEVEIVDLAKTTEYENIKELVTIGYGDTVECENERLGITTTAKCVNLIWDCILEQNHTVYLGDATINYFDKLSGAMDAVNSALNPDGTAKGEQVVGLIDMFKARMRATADGAKKQADKAILFEDLDPESEYFGAMALGTTGFMIANGRTPDNREWNWRTFGTGQGFFADFLVAGTLLSQNYVDGLSGFKINLNSGEIESSGLSIKSFSKDLNEKSAWKFEDGRLTMYDPDGKQSGCIYLIGSIGQDGNMNYVPRFVGNGEKEVEMMLDGTRGVITLAGKIELGGGTPALTGRVEFSNGTYMDFINGFLTNVKAANS